MPTWVSNCSRGRIIQTMNEYRPQDTISSLWDNIEMLHLAYLQEDQNPMKLEEKRRLEALIRRYLTLVPPQKKFLFPTTRQVLHDSIQANEDFSCYKTASAWHGIATYAHNLLTQPWRKEFRIIKLFNGFYKHNIERSLVGGDLMLELMGYRKIKDTLLIFEDPVDPDRVAGVSKDSLIASVECQIMRSIYAEVFKNTKDIKWMDIYIYRETYSGSVEDAVAALSHHHNPYSYGYHNPAAYYQPSMYPVSQAVPYVMSPHQVMPHLQLEQVYQSDGYHYRQALPDYHAARVMPRSSQYVTCPTGQLIEYETTLPPQSVAVVQHHHSHPQVTQHHRRSSSDHAVSTTGGDASYICHGRRPSHGYRSTYNSDTWGLDSDIWRTCSQEFVDREEQSNFAEQQNAAAAYFHKDISGGTWMSRDHSQKSEVNKPSINTDELGDSFKDLWKDDLSSMSEIKSKNTRKKKKNKDVFNKKTNREINFSTSLRVNLVPSVNLDENKWSCNFCTFLNSPPKEVCEMCGKSRSNEAEVPLASGGRQCPQCTLVNKRGAMKCDVCDTSLKDSPTYI